MLIADLTGARPSTGFVHGILRRCAHALGEVMTLVKTLVTRATVAGFDETTLRCGQAGRKNYVLSASTELCTLFFGGWPGPGQLHRVRGAARFHRGGGAPPLQRLRQQGRRRRRRSPDLLRAHPSRPARRR